MFKAVFFTYGPAFSRTVIYMLQAVEYRTVAYINWLRRAKDIQHISYRKELVPTRPARMLLWYFRTGELIEAAAAVALVVYGTSGHNYLEIAGGAFLLFFTPLVWSFLIVLPLVLGEILIIRPLYWYKVKRSERIFATHSGIKIAIAGSYGKTTMKEILLTVLSEGKNVAATPANKNVSISHALFAKTIKGDEDILIVEYGEGAPGDVARFARRTHPNVGVITGLAPAHLDRYKTLHAAGKDIFSLADYLKDSQVYVNGESPAAKPFIKKSYEVYSADGIGGWKVQDIKTGLSGTSFTLESKESSLKIKSRMLGRHQVGPLVLAAYLGKRYGLTDHQVISGIAKVETFEHRMKPYQLSGAWIIDDTYNGNIEGMKAGLALLKELPAERKIYVTPGLVDQGAESDAIHQELGQVISETAPDKVVLMRHSVTDSILAGMESYKGQVVIEEDPLDFYTNLDKFVAAGDLVMMQNDWPDNYD